MKAKKHEISSSDSEAVRKQKEKLAYKLNITKQAIIDVLTENPSGLSLAQLPLHLKYKLPFPLDLNELGYVKLKELLATMSSQVKIELRGHNHPFARLAHKPSVGGFYGPKPLEEEPYISAKSDKGHAQRYSDDFMHNNVEMNVAMPQPKLSHRPPYVDFNKHLEMIRSCVYGLLQEFPTGIESTKLPLLLNMRLGINLDWFVFGCGSLLEFLQKYITPYHELEFIPINPYDSNHFILRHKEAYGRYASLANYYNQQQFASAYFPIHYRFETDPNVLSSLPANMKPPSTVIHSVQPSAQFAKPPTSESKSLTSSISLNEQPQAVFSGIFLENLFL